MPATELNWYAFRTLWNTRRSFIGRMADAGIETYCPERISELIGKDGKVAEVRELVLPTIVFVRTTRSSAKQIQCDSFLKAISYNGAGTHDPAPIGDAEMNRFMTVTRLGCRSLESLDIKLVKGDRVRVTDGLFKGAEGYIVRVRGTRRFVVCIEGVAAVATTYIPQSFLEKVSNND